MLRFVVYSCLHVLKVKIQLLLMCPSNAYLLTCRLRTQDTPPLRSTMNHKRYLSAYDGLPVRLLPRRFRIVPGYPDVCM